MFINPKKAIKEGWITGEIAEKNIQPNAIDFTLDKLFTINNEQTFKISEDHKTMRGGEEVKAHGAWTGQSALVEPGEMYYEPFWVLEPRTSYDGMSNMYVELPDGVACMLIIRSTFNRNGLFLTSGLYDSGFKGHIGFALHNQSGYAHIECGTRVGQIIFVPSDNATTYAGGYNTEEGKHWTS